jgi:hypothetical protein
MIATVTALEDCTSEVINAAIGHQNHAELEKSYPSQQAANHIQTHITPGMKV